MYWLNEEFIEILWTEYEMYHQIYDSSHLSSINDNNIEINNKIYKLSIGIDFMY